MLLGNKLADAPQIIISIDPCLTCNDRLVVVDLRSGRERIVLLQDFIRRRVRL